MPHALRLGMSGASFINRLIPFLLGIVLLALAPAHARAQAVEAGVKGGVIFATITDLEDSFTIFCIALVGIECPRVNNDGLAGATGGGFVTLRRSDRFGVQAEALVVRKGTRIRFDSDVLPASLDLDLDVDVRLTYLELPVLGRFDIRRGRTGAYLLAGPVFGVNLAATARGGPGALFAGFTADIKDEVRPFDMGVAAGAGVTRGRLLFEGRFTQGVTDVNEASLALVRDVRNRTFAILGGVRF